MTLNMEIIEVNSEITAFDYKYFNTLYAKYRPRH